MNKKIPLRNLAENVSNRTGIDVDKVHIYVKTLFNVMGEQLLQTQTISLNGLGEFIVTHNHEEPIRFNVDTNLADELNAPFDMFKSIDIPKDIDRIELDKLSDEIVDAKQDDTVLNDSCDEFNPNENCFEPEENQEDLSLGVENNSTELVLDDEATVSEDIIKFEFEETPVKVQVENLTEIVEEVIPITDSESTNMPETTIDSELVIESSKIPEDEEEFVDKNNDIVSSSNSKLGLGFILGLVTGLILGALGFVCYILYFVETGSMLF